MLYTDEEINKRKKREKNIKNIITILVYIILVPLLLYNISMIIQAVVNPRETPNFFGIKSYVIISGSMQPNLNIGDIVIVKQTDDLQVGDIISFREGQSVVTHRITQVLEEDGNKKYITKGDNNNAEDSGLVNLDAIEGKVINKIPNIGKIALFLQGKVVILIIVIVFYIYYSYSIDIQKRKEARRQKRIEYEKR